ncbi:acyl-carrier-protein [Achromobacter phage Motura]|uniref:Acyl-carrier-protein n=1 Tax=Achromobacter phage Motura TaxID=2591403 RepID=A0A514CST6_9CAUD|nr:acyl-carrier-protein [Achromobacter phage Motura]QDH83547.1 acyl-carrier-protein [Achromobacter phage Motura]
MAKVKTINPSKYVLMPSQLKAPDGADLFLVKALRDGLHFKKGDVGGYVSSSYNLIQKDDSWVGPGAMVYGHAIVSGIALIADNARVFDQARVNGYSQVRDSSVICGEARVSDTYVNGTAMIRDACLRTCKISSKVKVTGGSITESSLYDSVQVHGSGLYISNCELQGHTHVSGSHDYDVYNLTVRDARIESADDYMVITSIGSEHGILYAFRNLEGILMVNRGCFEDTLDRFREKVERVHGKVRKREKVAAEYRLLIRLMELRFSHLKHSKEAAKPGRAVAVELEPKVVSRAVARNFFLRHQLLSKVYVQHEVLRRAVQRAQRDAASGRGPYNTLYLAQRDLRQYLVTHKDVFANDSAAFAEVWGDSTKRQQLLAAYEAHKELRAAASADDAEDIEAGYDHA